MRHWQNKCDVLVTFSDVGMMTCAFARDDHTAITWRLTLHPASTARRRRLGADTTSRVRVTPAMVSRRRTKL